MTDCEGLCDTLAARLRIHARAMTFRMNAADDAVLVKRQATQASEFASKQQSLIEAAFTLAFRMQRNGDDQVGAIERVALLRRKHQARQASGDMRLALQLQDGSPYGALIESARPRPAKGFVITPAAANTLTLIMANRGLSKQAALPAYGVVVSEDVSRLPARCTHNAVVARLDACAAHSARLGIDERQRGVVKRTWLIDRGSQK